MFYIIRHICRWAERQVNKFGFGINNNNIVINNRTIVKTGLFIKRLVFVTASTATG